MHQYFLILQCMHFEIWEKHMCKDSPYVHDATRFQNWLGFQRWVERTSRKGWNCWGLKWQLKFAAFQSKSEVGISQVKFPNSECARCMMAKVNNNIAEPWQIDVPLISIHITKHLSVQPPCTYKQNIGGKMIHEVKYILLHFILPHFYTWTHILMFHSPA